MPELPQSVTNWVMAGLIPAGGMLFLYLLKRTFKDFEDKIATLFQRLEHSLERTQQHDTRLAVIESKLEDLEERCPRNSSQQR